MCGSPSISVISVVAFTFFVEFGAVASLTIFTANGEGCGAGVAGDLPFRIGVLHRWFQPCFPTVLRGYNTALNIDQLSILAQWAF
jgi:hypothetical protein